MKQNPHEYGHKHDEYLSFTMSLWSDTLKTTACILDRVLSKSIPKTPFELWTGRKSLSPRVLGCQAEVKIYKQQISKKTKQKIPDRCYFVGYPNAYKG